METKSHAVAGIHRVRRVAAVVCGLEAVVGVEMIDGDLEAKLVRVMGDRLDATALVAAIETPGTRPR